MAKESPFKKQINTVLYSRKRVPPEKIQFCSQTEVHTRIDYFLGRWGSYRLFYNLIKTGCSSGSH